MIDYPKQLEIKKALAIETFSRIGKLDIKEILGVVPSPKPYQYRNTETFKVNEKKKLIGFFRKDTKFIVDIQECLLAMPQINTALADVRAQSIFSAA